MDEWQKDLTAMLESVASNVETFFEEVSQAIAQTAEDVQREVTTDFEQFLQTFLGTEVDVRVYFDGETFFNETFNNNEVDSFLAPKVDPTINVHPACRGCHHYHGRLYGGKLLVCGMHPYGWEDLNCPDWEGQSSHLN